MPIGSCGSRPARSNVLADATLSTHAAVTKPRPTPWGRGSASQKWDRRRLRHNTVKAYPQTTRICSGRRHGRQGNKGPPTLLERRRDRCLLPLVRTVGLPGDIAASSAWTRRHRNTPAGEQRESGSGGVPTQHQPPAPGRGSPDRSRTRPVEAGCASPGRFAKPRVRRGTTPRQPHTVSLRSGLARSLMGFGGTRERGTEGTCVRLPRDQGIGGRDGQPPPAVALPGAVLCAVPRVPADVLPVGPGSVGRST